MKLFLFCTMCMYVKWRIRISPTPPPLYVYTLPSTLLPKISFSLPPNHSIFSPSSISYPLSAPSLPPSSPPTPPLLPPPPYSVPLHEHKAEKSINPLRPPLLPFFLSFLHHPNHTPTPTHTHTPSLIPPSPPPPPPPSHAHNKTHLVRYHPPTMQHEEGKASEREREREGVYLCELLYSISVYILRCHQIPF